MDEAVIDTENQATSVLARHLYLHFCKYREFEPRPGFFAPEWAYDYAQIAVAYLGVPLDAVDVMTEDLAS
jgi:hypothetical protein